MTDLRPIAPQALAVAIGAAGGGAAYLLNIPLPWLLGAMLATTMAALAAAPIAPANALRPIFVPIIGVMLGSSVTPEIVGQMLGYGPALVILVPSLLAGGWGAYALMRRLGGYRPETAFYAAMPGGLYDMMILGEEAGGNGRTIALMHATRVLTIIAFAAAFYGIFFGITSQSVTTWIGFDALSPKDWAILGACAVLGAVGADRLRLPASQILGPMVLSGAAQASGLVDVPPPTLLVIAAQVVIGGIVGCRFVGATLGEIGRDMALGVAAAVAMIVAALACAAVLSAWAGDPLSLTFLVLSPGGVTEMSLLALAMEQDVVYVTTIHILRISVVIALARPIYLWLMRRGWIG